MTISHRSRAAGAAVALLGVLIGGSGGLAGQAPATPPPAGATEQIAFPARIHAGSCAAPGPVAFPLSNVGIPAPPGAPPAAPGGTVGAETALPAYVGNAPLPVPLDQILTAPHAVIVADPSAPDDPARFIACGDVGGIRAGDTLQFGLGALNESGYTGVVLIGGSPGGPANVTVYLSPNGREDAAVPPPS